MAKGPMSKNVLEVTEETEVTGRAQNQVRKVLASSQISLSFLIYKN